MFAITDTNGIEKFEAVSSWREELLPDDVSEVELTYSNFGKDITLRTFRLRFRMDSAELRLEFEGADARQLSAGIVHELDRAIAPFRRRFFVSSLIYDHMPFAVFGASIVVALMSVLRFLKPPANSDTDWNATGLVMIALVSTGFALGYSRMVFPYVRFETRKTNARQCFLSG